MAANDIGLEEVVSHLKLVSDGDPIGGGENGNNPWIEELKTTPLFSSAVRMALQSGVISRSGNLNDVLPQYALMGKRTAVYAGSTTISRDNLGDELSNLIYANVNSPWSTFICGSQGSGKSHTLSCMLENSLLQPSKTGMVSSALAGLVLHYDNFTGIETGQLCEAAYLCSSGIPVRVLVSPSRYSRMNALYSNLPGLPKGSVPPKVYPLHFKDEHLNIGMMKDLMAVGESGTPLYMEVVTRILREMAEESQGSVRLDFEKFKAKLEKTKLVRGQRGPLQMRLDLLEWFLEKKHLAMRESKKKKDGVWNFPKGTVTIIDLSCPFVDASAACSLFNICLRIFLEGRNTGGRIIALDEAHKFLDSKTREATGLTATLLSLIRQQRHLATRVIIATQEPTLSPSLLDLCNVAIVHRFTSPAWFKTLEGHLAGAVVGVSDAERSKYSADDLFPKIVTLRTGEALVFCPSAVVDVFRQENDGHGSTTEPGDSESELDNEEMDNEKIEEEYSSDEELDNSGSAPEDFVYLKQLGPRYMKVKIRMRVSADGGRSILAK